MRAVTIVIGLIGLLAVVVIGIGVYTLMPERAQQAQTSGSGVDHWLRIELAKLAGETEELESALAAIDANLRTINIDNLSGDIYSADGGEDAAETPSFNGNSELVLLENRRNLNGSLEFASESDLRAHLGMPRDRFTIRCEQMTDPNLEAMLETRSVGPLQVTLLRPALDSFARVMDALKTQDPALHEQVFVTGSTCVHKRWGHRGKLGAEAYGLAVDLNISSQKDIEGDGRAHAGLARLAALFREEGWAWGAVRNREQSARFEVSKQLLEQWKQAGTL